MGDGPFEVQVVDRCMDVLRERFGADAGVATSSDLAVSFESWIRAEEKRSAAWLHQVDVDGIPLRMARMRSVGSVTREMRLSVDSVAPRRVPRIMPDERPYASLEDGFAIVALVDPSAERREFRIQGLKESTMRILPEGQAANYYSLRNPDGCPVVTFKVVDDSWVTVHRQRERRDSFVGDDGEIEPASDQVHVVGRMLETFLRFGTTWRLSSPERDMGVVVDDKGDWHSVWNLPDGLKVSRGIDLSWCDAGARSAMWLPREMDAGSRLNLDGTAISLLPEGLRVDRLVLTRSEVRVVPDGVRVEKSIEVNPGALDSIGRDVADEVELRKFGQVWSTVGEFRNPRPRRIISHLPAFLQTS